MADQDEGLPESVQAEVDAIKREEGIATTDGKYTNETEQVAAPAPEKPKGRRSQLRDEELTLVRAAEDRASRAEQLAERTAKESAERLARLEGLIEAGNQHRQQPVYIQQAPQQQAPPKDWQAERRVALRDAQKALAAGDYDGWQENQDKANALHADELFNRRMQEFEQRMPVPQQQRIEKPVWLTAVEGQFPDVLSHPRGPGVAAAFMQMDGIGQTQQFNAEAMQKVFTKARKELGLSNGSAAPTEQQRQVHAGGPVNGSSRPSASNGAGKQVKVPKNWRQIARSAGMTEAQYLRAAKDME